MFSTDTRESGVCFALLPLRAHRELNVAEWGSAKMGRSTREVGCLA